MATLGYGGTKRSRAGFAGLADVAMTRIAQLTTEISIVVQLLGSITEGIAQVGEAGASGLTEIWSNTRDVLITGSGRLLMEMVTAAEIWPLCMVTRLRQVDNWVYEEANNTFINDEEMQKRLLETNPNSFRKLVSTFLEANGRGYWETSEENWRS